MPSASSASGVGSTGITSLRQRNREQNRAVTAEAAWRLFLARGYDHVTVQDICAAAQIAPRTFHRYFPSKEAVLEEPVQRMAQLVAEEIASAPADLDDAAVFTRAMRALGRFVIDNRDWIKGLRVVVGQSQHLRGSTIALRPDQEREMAALISVRRTQAGGPERSPAGEPGWRLRLLVATRIAALRIWLDDYFRDDPVDPLAHLDEILDAVGR